MIRNPLAFLASTDAAAEYLAGKCPSEIPVEQLHAMIVRSVDAKIAPVIGAQDARRVSSAADTLLKALPMLDRLPAVIFREHRQMFEVHLMLISGLRNGRGRDSEIRARLLRRDCSRQDRLVYRLHSACLTHGWTTLTPRLVLAAAVAWGIERPTKSEERQEVLAAKWRQKHARMLRVARHSWPKKHLEWLRLQRAHVTGSSANGSDL